MALIKAYSALLSQAEKDKENQSQQQQEDYRHLLEVLKTERETLLWVLDLNDKDRTTETSEYLIAIANRIAHASLPPTS